MNKTDYAKLKTLFMRSLNGFRGEKGGNSKKKRKQKPSQATETAQASQAKQGTEKEEEEGGDGSPASARFTEDDDSFHDHLFCMLARYSALEGGPNPTPLKGSKSNGLQGAGATARGQVAQSSYSGQESLHGTAFDVLRRHLDVRMELFASPLNARFGKFCSLFPDTDKVFGSVGSFFKVDLEPGSYQAFPPREGRVVLAMAKRMEEQLATVGGDGKGPLSLAVFVSESPAPEFRGGGGSGTADDLAEGLTTLRRSRYLSKTLVLEPGAHGFVRGDSYCQRPGRAFVTAKARTHVFFLQNGAARREWPVGEGDVLFLFLGEGVMWSGFGQRER